MKFVFAVILLTATFLYCSTDSVSKACVTVNGVTECKEDRGEYSSGVFIGSGSGADANGGSGPGIGYGGGGATSGNGAGIGYGGGATSGNGAGIGYGGGGATNGNGAGIGYGGGATNGNGAGIGYGGTWSGGFGLGNFMGGIPGFGVGQPQSSFRNGIGASYGAGIGFGTRKK